MIPSPTNQTLMSCLSVLLLYRAAHRRYGFSRSELWRGGAAGLYSDRSVACRVKFRYKPRCWNADGRGKHSMHPCFSLHPGEAQAFDNVCRTVSVATPG